MPRYLGMTALPEPQERALLALTMAELLRIDNQYCTPRISNAGDTYAVVQRLARTVPLPVLARLVPPLDHGACSALADEERLAVQAASRTAHARQQAQPPVAPPPRPASTLRAVTTPAAAPKPMAAPPRPPVAAPTAAQRVAAMLAALRDAAGGEEE